MGEDIVERLLAVMFSSNPHDYINAPLEEAALEIQRLREDRRKLLKAMRDVDDLVLAFSRNARTTLANGMLDD